MEVMYKTVKRIIRPPRLVECTIVETHTFGIKENGTRDYDRETFKRVESEKWSVLAAVETDYVPGEVEVEFTFPSEAQCAVIQPGYKMAV